MLDPRTGLILLTFSNVIAFSQNSIGIELGWFAVLITLLFLSGCGKQAVKWIAAFAAVILLQWYILPVSPKAVATSFSIFANYTRWMFPCMMVGVLMVKKVPLKNLIAALRRLHVPEKLIVAIAVTLRYIPAIREEGRHINDAMKLRSIKGIQKAEALVVPLMVSATGTAEELSAAAVTRGIENPAPKTSLVELSMTALDWIYIFAAIAFTLAALVIK